MSLAAASFIGFPPSREGLSVQDVMNACGLEQAL